MITNKTFLEIKHFPKLVLGYVFAYICTGALFQTCPPEIHEFAYRTCFLLILLYFLKATGVTPQSITSYSLAAFIKDLSKASKFFLIVSLGVIAFIAIAAGILALLPILNPDIVRHVNLAQQIGGIAVSLHPSFTSPTRTLFYLLTTCAIAPLAEEIFFRRFLYVSLRVNHNKVYAIIISALLFGAAHFENFIFGTTMGLVLAYIYEKEEKLTIPILFHALKNTTAILASILLYYIW